jgi:hypothetical protein
MQQPQLTTYAEIAEVRTVTGAAACNQLLAEGWVLMAVMPLTMVGEMSAGQPGDGQQGKRIEDTQRYVRWPVGYVVAGSVSRLVSKMSLLSVVCHNRQLCESL